MQRPQDAVQFRFTQLVEAAGPVLAAVASAFLIILGILVIIFPRLLDWVAGIGLVLAGVGVLAASLVMSVNAPRH